MSDKDDSVNLTLDDLVDDLSRLLREGLAFVDDHDDQEDVPRFRVTARGREELLATCDHTFIDSPACLKCGWTPPEDQPVTLLLVDPSIGKSTWGNGPWQTEPDRVDFTHAGLPCLAKRNHWGSWCGYVAVPSGHPLHGMHFDHVVDVNVHGSLSYSDRCQHDLGICHVPSPGEPDDVWWLGFSCDGTWDISPARDAFGRTLGHAPIRFDECSYKTLDYVRAEIMRLAEQLAARGVRDHAAAESRCEFA
jgi:hypothetical protein